MLAGLQGETQSAVSERVYLIEDGRFVAPARLEHPENGFTPQQAHAFTHPMLGAGLEDLLPRPVVVTEPSVQRLIETVWGKLDTYFPGFFWNASDGDTIVAAKHVGQLVQMVRNYESNRLGQFLFSSPLVAICDDEKAADDLRAALETDESAEESYESDGRIWALGDQELEDGYPSDWVHDWLAQFVPSGTWDLANIQKIGANGVKFKTLLDAELEGAARESCLDDANRDLYTKVLGKQKLTIADDVSVQHHFDRLPEEKQARTKKALVAARSGQIKSELATYVGEKINSVKELETHLPRLFELWEATRGSDWFERRPR